MLSRFKVTPLCMLNRMRGMKTAVADLRKGDWINNEGRIMVVHQTNSTFSGRGARQFTLTLRDPITENLTTLKPTAKEAFEKMELKDVACQYLYETDGIAYLLDPKTLEEITVPINLFSGHLSKVLEGGMEVKVRMNENKCVMVHNGGSHHKCTVAKVAEEREAGGRRTVIVETVTGLKIACNSALKEGDQIILDQHTLSFLGRA